MTTTGDDDNGRKLSLRGQAARAKLKSAALVVMERTGYHRMRIHDVTAEAGVAAGLFYHYFKDLKSLTIEVLEDYIAEARRVDIIERVECFALEIIAGMRVEFFEFSLSNGAIEFELPLLNFGEELIVFDEFLSPVIVGICRWQKEYDIIGVVVCGAKNMNEELA